MLVLTELFQCGVPFATQFPFFQNQTLVLLA
jgi:hypothetical protein